MRQAGMPMSEIGRAVSVSRERVRQILLRTFGSTTHELLSTTHASVLTGFSVNHIKRLYKLAIISPAFSYNIGRQHRFIWPMRTLQDVKDYYNLHHICCVCQKPIPSRRILYCSDLCKKKRYKGKKLIPK